jgi:hypothetical protein
MSAFAPPARHGSTTLPSPAAPAARRHSPTTSREPASACAQKAAYSASAQAPSRTPPAELSQARSGPPLGGTTLRCDDTVHGLSGGGPDERLRLPAARVRRAATVPRYSLIVGHGGGEMLFEIDVGVVRDVGDVEEGICAPPKPGQITGLVGFPAVRRLRLCNRAGRREVRIGELGRHTSATAEKRSSRRSASWTPRWHVDRPSLLGRRRRPRAPRWRRGAGRGAN